MDIYTHIGEIIAAIIVALFAMLVPKLRAYLTAAAQKTQTEELLEFIYELVRAAEQQYKKNDPTGEKRLSYCKKILFDEKGISLTPEIRAIIEGAVYELNGTPKYFTGKGVEDAE